MFGRAVATAIAAVAATAAVESVCSQSAAVFDYTRFPQAPTVCNDRKEQKHIPCMFIHHKICTVHTNIHSSFHTEFRDGGDVRERNRERVLRRISSSENTSHKYSRFKLNRVTTIENSMCTYNSTFVCVYVYTHCTYPSHCFRVRAILRVYICASETILLLLVSFSLS